MDDKGKVSLDRINKPDAPAGSGAPRPSGDRPRSDRPGGGSGHGGPRRQH